MVKKLSKSMGASKSPKGGAKGGAKEKDPDGFTEKMKTAGKVGGKGRKGKK